MIFTLLPSLFLLSLCLSVKAKDMTTEKQTLSTKAAGCNVNNYNSFYAGPNKKVESILVDIKRQLDEIYNVLGDLSGKHVNTTKAFYKNCAALYEAGQRTSGVYTIKPDSSHPFEVFCDQATAGGGWTVFQKRLDGSVDFYRGWNDYKNGFGDLNGEFWLGLDKINRLTKSNRNRLRVELEDIEGNTAYAEYDMFAVSSEKTKYQLSLGSYSGTAGDSLISEHRGMAFSTKDRDNDKYGPDACAVLYKGGWWYNDCHYANLNGLYLHGAHKSYANGVNWHTWKGYHYSVKKAEMKIKPVGA